MTLLSSPDFDALVHLTSLASGCSYDVYVHELTAALNGFALLPLAAFKAAAELFDSVRPADPDTCLLPLAVWVAGQMSDALSLSVDMAGVVRDLMICVCAKGSPEDGEVLSRLAGSDPTLTSLGIVLCAMYLSLLLSSVAGLSPTAPLLALARGERWPHAVAVCAPLPRSERQAESGSAAKKFWGDGCAAAPAATVTVS